MKIRIAAAIAAAGAVAFSAPCVAFNAGVGSMSARSGGGFGHPIGGFHGHHLGFRPFFPFQTRQPDFGTGFRSHNALQTTGGYGGDSDDDYDNDDISSLHFRVQEPFGPGDIGRPPERGEADGPYMQDGYGPPPGYEPENG